MDTLEILNTIYSMFNGLLFSGLVLLPLYVKLSTIIRRNKRLQCVNKYIGNTFNTGILRNRIPESEIIKDINFTNRQIPNKDLLVATIDKLLKSIDDEDKTHFFENIATLKFKYIEDINSSYLIKRDWIKDEVSGNYSPIRNSFNYKIDEFDIYFHELVHMASSKYDAKNRIGFCGFRQFYTGKNKVITEIGRTVNEGYTSLFCSRNNNNSSIRGYHEEIRLVKLIELFFDNPKDMQHLYFGHDLPGLIRKMEGYSSRQEVIEFLVKCDVNFEQNRRRIISKINFFAKDVLTNNDIEQELTLYKWFMAKCADEEKRRKFMSILCERPKMWEIINTSKYALYRDSPYTMEISANKVA